jgi:hypothetical protein
MHMSRFFEAMKRRILCSAIWGTALVGSLLACGSGAAGTPPERPEAVAGQWELSLDQTPLKCRLALRIEAAGTGARLLALPYGCRKAFPILADARGWTLGADGRVELLDAAGIALLRFTAVSAERLTAGGPRDEIYRLTAAHALAAVDGSASGRVVERLDAATKSTAPARNMRPSDLSGRYAVLREGGKDTGCMLTLDSTAPAKGGSKAFLAPACRDQGIVIFDPVGWRLASGRLVLTARKGHSTELDLQADGTWMKDPKDGKSLGLKKL